MRHVAVLALLSLPMDWFTFQHLPRMTAEAIIIGWLDAGMRLVALVAV